MTGHPVTIASHEDRDDAIAEVDRMKAEGRNVWVGPATTNRDGTVRHPIVEWGAR